MSCDNKIKCTCTKFDCPRHGKCCACVAYHNKKQQFPACLFSAEAEKSYDRGFSRLKEDREG